jgi:hypothetical protein
MPVTDNSHLLCYKNKCENTGTKANAEIFNHLFRIWSMIKVNIVSVEITPYATPTSFIDQYPDHSVCMLAYLVAAAHCDLRADTVVGIAIVGGWNLSGY